MQNLANVSTRIEPIKRRLVTDLIIERLVPAIATGSFPPGYRLVEDELAGELGVSRVPVREAIRELSLQGILCSGPGRGWRIAPFDDKQVREVCTVRIALETALLTEALPNFRSDPSRFAGIDEAVSAMERAASFGDVEGIRHADVEFHRAAVSVAGNSVGLRIWEGISRQVMIIFGLEINRGPDLQVVVDQHRKLRRYLAEGDPSGLGELLREHITERIQLKESPSNSDESTT